MKLSKKTLVGIISLGALVALAIAGTYAYLTDKTATLANTFTVGAVGIDLTEPAWTAEGANHTIVPGVTIGKDPTVTVDANSQEAYVFIKVATKPQLAALKAFYTLDISGDWVLVEETDLEAVYTYKTTVASSSADVALAPLFTNIVFSNELTAAQLATLTEAQIDVTAYAIQASGLADAATAWAEVSK